MQKKFIYIFVCSFLAIVSCELDGWESIGCWRDLPTRAIASLEGKNKYLTGHWKTRSNALQACANAAKNESLKVFAVQDGGQCFGGPYAQFFFDQYGPSNLCKGGAGGIWSNDVYSSSTSYRRVLETKKENEKLIRCSKPLDLMFLVDGAGDQNTENKLRWAEMLKFISKATELFDPISTRFGVISFGSKPKVIVDMTKSHDEISTRDTIISENFPGGSRTINEALKTTWQEQFKRTKGGKNKVIVALTTGNMDYGPWGSSLFLTNKGVRILAFGIDKAPSYRYLESLASGKHPENIYSLDSEQLDKALPFIAKDICTGAKRSRIETIRKDKEIDFISSKEFETVGSVIERKSKQGAVKDSQSSNDPNEANSKAEKEEDKKFEKNGKMKAENTEINAQQVGTNALQNQEAKAERGKKGESYSKANADLENLMFEGSYEAAPGSAKIRKIVEGDAREVRNVTTQTKSAIFPIDNSSLPDGEIIEKLKESAVASLKKSASDVEQEQSGEPLVRNPIENKEHKKTSAEVNLGSKVNFNYKATKNSKTDSYVGSGESKHNDAKEAERRKETSTTRKTKNGSMEAGFKATPVSYGRKDDEVKSMDLKNETSGKRNASGYVEKAVDTPMEYKGEKSEGQLSEGQMAAANKQQKGDRPKGSNAQRTSKYKTAQYSRPTSNQARYSDASGQGNDVIQGQSVAHARNATADEAKEAKNQTMIVSSGKTEQNSVGNGTSANSEFDNAKKEKAEKDTDDEAFAKMQKERESIDADIANFHSDNETKISENDSKASEDDFMDDDTTAEEARTMAAEPLDDISLDADEQATQRALEEKKQEIDILLKKLDEKRKRRRKRKVLHRANVDENMIDSYDREVENFAENDDGHEEAESEQHLFESDNEAAHKDKPTAKQTDSSHVNGKKQHHQKQKAIYSRPVARHFLLISQNDSKPFPIKRPFGFIPTKKAVRILDRLYNVNNKSNLTVKYDMFDPTYSSKVRHPLTKDSYKKLVQNSHAKKARAPLVGRQVKSRKKTKQKLSDKQQFFLRNTISNGVAYDLKRAQSQTLVPGKQNQTQVFNGQSGRGRRRKEGKKDDKILQQKRAPEAKKAATDLAGLRRTLNNYFTSYMKKIGPVSDVYQHNQPISYASKRNVDQSKNVTKSSNRALIGRAITSPMKYTNINTRPSAIGSSQNENQERRIDYKPEQMKVENAISRNVIETGEMKDNFNLSKFHFSSLEKLDSGNYSIYKVSKHRILVSLQSKTGRLETFYGTTSPRNQIKQSTDGVRKTGKYLALELASDTSSADAKTGRGMSDIATKMKDSSSNDVRRMKGASFVDNVKYFQSSLGEKSGSTRSLHDTKIKQKKSKKRSKHHKQNGTVKYEAAKESRENVNRTAFDVFDNRLAHVNKPISYFVKNNRDPDRLIITEHSDPYTDSSMVKLFINAGDENSLMPTGSMGSIHNEGGSTKSMMMNMPKEDDFSKANNWSKDVGANSERTEDGAVKGGLEGDFKTGNADKKEVKLTSNGIKKIVEVAKQGPDNAEASSQRSDAVNTKSDAAKNLPTSLKTSQGSSQLQHEVKKGSEKAGVTPTARSRKPEHGSQGRLQRNHGMKAESSNKDDVWVFKADPEATKNSLEKVSGEKKIFESTTKQKDANMQGSKGSTTSDSKYSSTAKNGVKAKDEEGKVKDNEVKANDNEVKAKDEALLSQLGQAMGCTRPVKVLYLIDVSDAIGTGPTRQRKWNHMKRFLHSVNERVTHGGDMGYIVFDTEPRYLSSLEPCDEKTEYFVTSGECLCDRRAASYRRGATSCSTHAPTQDESIEDWGKQGPRTAKALQLAQRFFRDEAFGNSKKMVVLVTHQASTDDVTAAERSLKDDSISLVDIEIGERHNLRKRSLIKKRSNTFDDVIPKDHQMEVSFYKLDKAIENIFMKICKEKDPAKSRRSRIYATVKRHSKWW